MQPRAGVSFQLVHEAIHGGDLLVSFLVGIYHVAVPFPSVTFQEGTPVSSWPAAAHNTLGSKKYSPQRGFNFFVVSADISLHVFILCTMLYLVLFC